MILTLKEYLVVCDSCGTDGDGTRHLSEEDALYYGQEWEVGGTAPVQHLCDECMKDV